MREKNFREFKLESRTKVLLGKDEKSNDELVKKFEGEENVMLHTSKPGSPFGVIQDLNPSKEEIYQASVFVARYSQDWRDNKSDVEVNVFTGKDVSKPKGYKPGSWKVNHKGKNAKTIKVKKKDIIRLEK